MYGLPDTLLALYLNSPETNTRLPSDFLRKKSSGCLLLAFLDRISFNGPDNPGTHYYPKALQFTMILLFRSLLALQAQVIISRQKRFSKKNFKIFGDQWGAGARLSSCVLTEGHGFINTQHEWKTNVQTNKNNHIINLLLRNLWFLLIMEQMVPLK